MKNFFVTTSIAYANAPPHLGFALESVQADVLARRERSRGREVFFQTGTDEHGVKVARAAEAAGKSPAEFTDELATKVRSLKEALNLSWDVFVRTSDKKKHFPAAENLWKKMAAAGDLYKKEYEGRYCVGCEAFLAKKDLKDGKCAIHQKEPETVREENYFFRLSKYARQVESKIKEGTLKIIPESRRNEALAFIERGLEDVSFSRPAASLKWGIPVPGDETQVMYVWADALSNYLDFGERWPADVHFIGKDILKFHAVIWPAMLLSAGLPLPGTIFAHGFITVGGQKMSKSLGNVADPFRLVEKYGADAVRYYLLREIPAYEDGDFTEEKFKNRYNGDLANGLGNFAARVLTLADGLKVSTDEINDCLDGAVASRIEETKKEINGKLDNFRFHEALAAVWELIGFGDRYVNENRPWETRDRRIILNLAVILDNLAALLPPFLPETADKIGRRISRENGVLAASKGEPLFPRF